MLDARNSNTKIQVHVTEQAAAPSGSNDFKICRGEINFINELSQIMTEFLNEDIIGVYTCGPEEFMTECGNSCADHTGRILFERETFTY